MAKRVPPLTAAAVAKIKPDPGRTLEFVDGDVPGLRLRVEALTVEGVSTADINTFIRSIKPQVDQLIADCDAVQRTTARSVKPEYDAMKAGSSSMERICAEALCIAEQAVTFCEGRGVL